MLVGLDFDNTIVCYDALFHRLARERGLLAEDVPATKGHVRDYLRRIGREDDWTEMQGIGYGPRIVDAAPFPGVLDFLNRCLRLSVRCAVVSHKTRTPYLGEKHDLHAAAHDFLRAHGFYNTAVSGLTPTDVHLELTKQAKIDRIAALRCDTFVDDLPEFLGEASFPRATRKVLFDPAGACGGAADCARARSWAEVGRLVLGAGGSGRCAA
jgi:hypothetical protein